MLDPGIVSSITGLPLDNDWIVNPLMVGTICPFRVTTLVEVVLLVIEATEVTEASDVRELEVTEFTEAFDVGELELIDVCWTVTI
jgi:hypothetical protein